jgi:hypothetical protein
MVQTQVQILRNPEDFAKRGIVVWSPASKATIKHCPGLHS